MFLVCTHGRHDACCARFGRPVAEALARLRPDDVWECSHLGGDRFAANVLALPAGDLYGHVAPTDADRLVAAVATGSIVVDLWRGRARLPQVAQAAVAALLADGVDPAAIDWAGVRCSDGEDGDRVDVPVGDQVCPALVRSGLAPPYQLTCNAHHPSQARTFDVEVQPPG